jgi:NADH-ubiquinone oxidoreductase chain 4
MLTLLLVMPLLGVLGVSISNSSENQKRIALGITLINFIISLVLWGQFDSSYNGFQFVQEFTTVSFCHLHVGIDGISLWFVLLTTFLIPMCLLASWESITVFVREFVIAFLVLETLLIGVFVVLDLLLFYIAFESVLIPMFLVIGVWGSRERKIHAAYYFFLFTLLGSLFMLLAVLVLYFSAGSSDYIVLATADLTETRQRAVWLGIFLAFAVKVPILPFYVWLPYAHTEAPIGGSIILAGILLKLAGYGFLRFSIGILPDASAYFTPLVYALSVISIIYSSFTTLRQFDLKSIVAYSSIGHINVVNLGIFSNTIQGIEGSILLMLAHGIVSPALFICVTILYDRHHTRVLKYYRGMVLNMPVYTVFFFVFTLANIATPLSANFVGEFMTFTGGFQQNPVLTILGALSIVLSAAYSIWLFNRVSFGASSVYLTPVGDINRREFMLLLPLLFLTLLIGIFPNFLLEPLHLSVSNLLHPCITPGLGPRGPNLRLRR